MKRYFITGTDTDCGKTYVTGKLVDLYPKAAAIKPIASGCDAVNGQLVSSDAKLLQQKSNLSLDQINPWRFELAASPHIAAKEAGLSINVQEVADYCLGFQAKGIETLFIEGAGGLMVPLNEQETWIEFLKLTKIPVILVVGMKLGCINHALLTQFVLKENNIACAGWVANCLDPNVLALEQQIITLKNKMNGPYLFKVQNLSGIQLSEVEQFDSII